MANDEIIETYIFMGKDGEPHNLELVESDDGRFGLRFEEKTRYFDKEITDKLKIAGDAIRRRDDG